MALVKHIDDASRDMWLKSGEKKAFERELKKVEQAKAKKVNGAK